MPTTRSASKPEIHQDPYFVTGAGKDYGLILSQARAELVRIGMSETEFAELPGSHPLTMMPIERLRSVVQWAQSQETAKDDAAAALVATFGSDGVAPLGDDSPTPTTPREGNKTVAPTDDGLSFVVSDQPDALEPAIYSGKLLSITREVGTKSFEEGKAPEDFFKWRFQLDLGDGTTEDVSATSSMRFTKGVKQVAKARKWAEALLGRDIEDGEQFNLRSLFGLTANINLIIDEKSGYNRIEAVLPARKPGRRQAPAAAPVATLSEEEAPF